jgi:hypothetical protein
VSVPLLQVPVVLTLTDRWPTRVTLLHVPVVLPLQIDGLLVSIPLLQVSVALTLTEQIDCLLVSVLLLQEPVVLTVTDGWPTSIRFPSTCTSSSNPYRQMAY